MWLTSTKKSERWCFGYCSRKSHRGSGLCHADRTRVLDGLAGASQKGDLSEADLGRNVQRLATRWFIINNAHEASIGPILLHPRQTMSFMRGPMTRNEILRAREWRAQLEGVELPPNSVARPQAMVEMPESVRKPKAFGFTDDAEEWLKNHAEGDS